MIRKRLHQKMLAKADALIEYRMNGSHGTDNNASQSHFTNKFDIYFQCQLYENLENTNNYFLVVCSRAKGFFSFV